MTATPRSVRVASQRATVGKYRELVKVDEHGHEENLYGSLDALHMHIGLLAGMAPERERLTFMHEVTHLIWTVGRFDDCTTEEQFVGRFSPLLLSFIRENVAVIKYLQEVVRP